MKNILIKKIKIVFQIKIRMYQLRTKLFKIVIITKRRNILPPSNFANLDTLHFITEVKRDLVYLCIKAFSHKLEISISRTMSISLFILIKCSFICKQHKVFSNLIIILDDHHRIILEIDFGMEKRLIGNW